MFRILQANEMSSRYSSIYIFAYLTISKGYLSYFIPQGIHPGYA